MSCEWVEVELTGVRWSVAPVYIFPVGIGEALKIALAHGCELPSPALVDAIWSAADLKVDPLPRGGKSTPPNDFTPRGMSTPEVYADQAARIQAQITGQEFHLLAGTHKDVVSKGGKVAIYGWHRTDGTVIQPFFTGHSMLWKDYSQGLRLCRRIK